MEKTILEIMEYVVVHICNGLKYYVQDYKGKYQLNGLIDNAIKFGDEVDVIEASKQLEYILHRKLVPMEVPAKTKE